MNRGFVTDYAFKYGIGVDVNTIFKILDKKVDKDKMSEIGQKALTLVMDEVEKLDINNEHKVILHNVIINTMFKSSMIAFNIWAEKEAKKLGLKTDKFIKIMYHL